MSFAVNAGLSFDMPIALTKACLVYQPFAITTFVFGLQTGADLGQDSEGSRWVEAIMPREDNRKYDD